MNWHSFYLGAIAGLTLCFIGVVFAILEPGTRILDQCERQHNVYACTLQAVPVSQPSWVSNG